MKMNNKKEQMLACAKGHWQREIVADLIRYGVIDNPIKELRGSAKEYKYRYEESFSNLISRLEAEADVKVRIVQYGPRGGRWGAKYGIV